MNPAMIITALALAGGVAMAVQAPTNALLGRAAGSPITAALISFAVGTVALALVSLASGPVRIGPEVKDLPWYAWLGGIYGAFFVAVAAIAAPRIGVGALFTAAVAGQLLAALVLDHFGLFGVDRHPASFGRIAGVVLVMAGAWLVRRG